MKLKSRKNHRLKTLRFSQFVDMDIYFISDLVGIVGVALVISGFFFVQLEKITHRSSYYLYSNFLGALMLLFSLYYHWNLASVVIEILWLLITIYGIVKFKILR